MKKIVTIICLTILTAALIVASTAIAFASPNTTDVPKTATNVPETATDVPETATDAICDEQSNVTTRKDTDMSKFSISTEAITSDKIETEKHVCAIEYAKESYHRYSCDECENYSLVYHNEYTMSLTAKNEWFHTWGCEDCGYEYAEKHTFRTAYTSEGHYDTCTECGYATDIEKHFLINDFHGFYHDINCNSCHYKAKRHIGVTYTLFDANYCEATCKKCGTTEYVPHEWDGLECDNCGYKLGYFTFGVIAEVNYCHERYCTVKLLANNEYFYINVDSYDFKTWNCDEGDFVQIFHIGNDIYDIALLIDGNVTDDIENFSQYVYEDFIFTGMPEDLTFNDILINAIDFSDVGTSLTFDSERAAIDITTPYVVYDMRNCRVGELCVGDAILTYCPFGTTTYVVILW